MKFGNSRIKEARPLLTSPLLPSVVSGSSHSHQQEGILHLFNKHQRFAHHLSLLQASSLSIGCGTLSCTHAHIHFFFSFALSLSPWKSDCFCPLVEMKQLQELFLMADTFFFFISDRLPLSWLWGCFCWHNWCLPPGFSVISKTSARRVDYCATGDFSCHWKQQHDNHIYKM